MSQQLAVIPVVMKYRLGRRDQVKFQLLVHFHFKGIKLTDNELECLTLLAIGGKQRLTEFCRLLTTEGVSQTVQSARNTLTKLTDMGLVGKEGSNRKLVYAIPGIEVIVEGSSLVNIQCAYIDESA